MSALRLAVVGAGAMGALHARVVQGSARTELAGVVDLREDVGREVAERFDAPWSPDLAGLGRVDAVVVAAATRAHHTLALEVLAAGLPVLVEKPMADDLAECEEIVSAAEVAGLPLMCGLLERWNSAVVTASRLTRDPVHVSAARHSPYAPRIPTGVAWDLLIHDVDLVLRLMAAEPTSIDARLGYLHPASTGGAEDVAEVQLGFARGQLAALSASRIGQRKTRMLRISEVDREIEVDLLRQVVTIYRHVDAEALSDEGRVYRQQTIIEIPTITPLGEPLAAQLAHFVDLVEGRADPEAERAGILPAHRVVAASLAAAGAQPAAGRP